MSKKVHGHCLGNLKMKLLLESLQKKTPCNLEISEIFKKLPSLPTGTGRKYRKIFDSTKDASKKTIFILCIHQKEEDSRVNLVGLGANGCMNLALVYHLFLVQ